MNETLMFTHDCEKKNAYPIKLCTSVTKSIIASHVLKENSIQQRNL